MARTQNNQKLRDSAILALFASLMFASKILMEFLPNIHLLGLFIMLLTVVYRARALISVYLYVMLDGLVYGFSPWWVPYLYVWAILWGATMLLPRQMKKKSAMIVYPAVCMMHGLLFGILYAPAQALMYGLSFEGMLHWIVMGFPYDLIHGVSNLIVGTLIYPLSVILMKLKNGQYR